MAESAIELVRRGYAAFNRGDVDAALADMDPGVEVYTSGAFLDEGAVYRGREGVRSFLDMVADAFEELRYELEEAIDVGDGRLLALVRIRGRGKGSGVGVDTRLAHLWTVRDGEAVRMQAFTDRDEARRAAGLA